MTSQILQPTHDTQSLFDCHPIWPSRRRHAERNGTVPRALILGRPVQDFEFELSCTLQELSELLLSEREKHPLRFNKRERVGGFPVWAARAARKIGAQVWLSTVFPLPVPHAFSRFLEECNVDTTYCSVFPGRPAATIHLSCRDGHRLLTRPGVENAFSPPVPATVFHDFDIVLAKPGALPTRRSVLKKLRNAGRPQGRMPVVALVLGPDYTAEDFELLRDEPDFYLFCNQVETLSIAAELTGNQAIDIEQAAKAVKARIGETKLVVSLGGRGAMLMNGKTTFFSRYEKPVDGRDTTGCGDKLATVAASELAKRGNEFLALESAVATDSRDLAS